VRLRIFKRNLPNVIRMKNLSRNFYT